MKPAGHIIASGLVSVVVWHYFRSMPAAIASFLSGTLIDLDHFFDYYANHHFTLSIRKAWAACEIVNFKKLYVLAHSYELIIALWVAIAVFSLGAVWKGIAIGLTQHMLLDQTTNPMTIPGYFLIYRIMNGFEKDSILKKKEHAA